MARFDRTYRQRIIDEFLNDTRRNIFVPSEFLEWLSDKPDHRAYPVFFGKSDEEAAEAYRINLVRSFVSGLRIAVRVSPVVVEQSGVEVKVNESSPMSVRIPAFTSPASDRKGGGGYYPTDPSDPAVMAELRRQAAADLRKVVARHEGVAALAGVSMQAVLEIASALDAEAISEAA